MSDMYKKRIEALTQWLTANSVAAIVFEDSERQRTPSLRYYTGMPSDAVLVVSAKGKTVLSPWDENIARMRAAADVIIPYNTFDRQPVTAVSEILRRLKIEDGERIEIPDSTPYPVFLRYVDAMSDFNVLCRENGGHAYARSIRSCKDAYELKLLREAAKITDTIIDNIEQQVLIGAVKTETDAALLIEREARRLGAESTSFETLAAGPSRSFGIHCFPSYTDAPFPAQGLSILDFGVTYEGYCSDVTVTFAKGELTPAQDKQIALVEKAYETALKLYEKDVPVRLPAVKADEIFSKAKRAMPHSLGHGTGLEVHEEPFVRSRADIEAVFKPGMVVTLEPGLYDPDIGGCRLENDVLITENGNEVLTHSRIIRLP